MKLLKKTFAIACATALTIAIVPAHAQSRTTVHHHYKLVSLGTFGGPNSFLYGFTKPINVRGAVTGCAETALLDPNLSIQNPYFGGDAYIQHSYRRSNGVRTRLKELPGGANSCTQWMNDFGVVVGASDTGVIDPLTGLQQIRAVLWDEKGKAYNLGTIGGNGSVAWAINNAGQVTGNALNAIPDDFNFDGSFGILGATQTHAFLWENGIMKDLGTLGGPDSGPYAINGKGQVVGFAMTSFIANPSTGSPTVDPFFWDGTRMVDLGSLGGTNGTAVDVNDRGQVTGDSFLAGDDPWQKHAFLWPGSDGKMIDLPTLGGGSESKAINELGDVTGASWPEGGDVHAILWHKGKLLDLGVVPGDVCAEGMAINSRGQVVGFSNHDVCVTEDHSHGFLWENGALFDLNQLISNSTNLTVIEGVRINEQGEIAGRSITPEGDNRAVVLIPCDERHPNLEGCDYSAVEESVAQRASSDVRRPSERMRSEPRPRFIAGARR